MTSVLARPGEHAPDPAEVAARAAADTEQRTAQLDFRVFGTRPRILVEVVEDVSPSEIDHEREWRDGSRSIAEEIARNPAARNLVDVAFCTGAESFDVLSLTHGKDFTLPAGKINYGRATYARSWLAGSKAVVEAYKARLANLGIGVRDVVVVIASDFAFGDDFRADLAAFKEWAAVNSVTVVPAGFGEWSEAAAAEFSAIPPTNLKNVSFAQFFRVVSESVARVSQSAPGTGLMARALERGLKGIAEEPTN